VRAVADNVDIEGHLRAHQHLQLCRVYLPGVVSRQPFRTAMAPTGHAQTHQGIQLCAVCDS